MDNMIWNRNYSPAPQRYCQTIPTMSKSVPVLVCTPVLA